MGKKIPFSMNLKHGGKDDKIYEAFHDANINLQVEARVSCEVDGDSLMVEHLQRISKGKSLSLAINYQVLLAYSCDSPLPTFLNLKHLELKGYYSAYGYKLIP